MESTQSLPLLTWVVLLGPMPLVLVLAAAGYLRARRLRQWRHRE